jgi:hypothetical protein
MQAAVRLSVPACFEERDDGWLLILAYQTELPLVFIHIFVTSSFASFFKYNSWQMKGARRARRIAITLLLSSALVSISARY